MSVELWLGREYDHTHEMKALGEFLMFQIFCYFKFFDHDLPDDHDENYYFEREWKIVGNLKFTLNDIKRIISD